MAKTQVVTGNQASVPGDVDAAGNAVKQDKQPPAPTIRAATPETTADKTVTKERMQLERKRRIYVRRAGGFRKHLHPDDIAEGERVCKEYGRPAVDGWDPAVYIPGYDNVNHDVNQKKNTEK